MADITEWVVRQTFSAAIRSLLKLEKAVLYLLALGVPLSHARAAFLYFGMQPKGPVFILAHALSLAFTGAGLVVLAQAFRRLEMIVRQASTPEQQSSLIWLGLGLGAVVLGTVQILLWELMG